MIGHHAPLKKSQPIIFLETVDVRCSNRPRIRSCSCRIRTGQRLEVVGTAEVPEAEYGRVTL
jgi:hypothetical protein